MKLSEKLILVDCDGVLVDWQYGFFRWMRDKGHEPVVNNEYDIAKTFGLPKDTAKALVRHFNESAAMGWLPQFRDSIKYVRKLHEDHGYIFHCITSLSLDEYAGRLRRKNLEALFGKTVFEKVECLDCGADKDEALLPYKDSGCLFIEDKPENAIAGINAGLQSILITHEHNIKFDNASYGISRVNYWKEIYEMLT
jgi:FMN phosphatase YigB (HAD superfamily)